MAETLLAILIYCILLAISLGILYWIIKKAVKNGVLEACQDMEHPPKKVTYPVKIDEDNPTIPFVEDETP